MSYDNIITVDITEKKMSSEGSFTILWFSDTLLLYMKKGCNCVSLFWGHNIISKRIEELTLFL